MKKRIVLLAVLALSAVAMADDLIVTGNYADAMHKGTGTYAVGSGFEVAYRDTLDGDLKYKVGLEHLNFGLAKQGQPGRVKTYSLSAGLELGTQLNKSLRVALETALRYIIVHDSERDESDKLSINLGGLMEWGDPKGVRVQLAGGFAEQLGGSKAVDRNLYSGPYMKIGFVIPL